MGYNYGETKIHKDTSTGSGNRVNARSGKNVQGDSGTFWVRAQPGEKMYGETPYQAAKAGSGNTAEAQGPPPQGWSAATRKRSHRAGETAAGEPAAAGFSGACRKGGGQG